MNTTLVALQHLEQPALSHGKRSLLSFVGDTLSSLFGTTTKTQPQDILSQINDVKGTQDRILNVIDSTVTVLHQTIVDVNMNRVTINRLTNITNHLTDRLDQKKLNYGQIFR